MTSPAAPTTPADLSGGTALRHFGRFQLLRLLGKSEKTMAWRVADPRTGQDLVLVMPRRQPATTDALTHWTDAVRRAGRLNHPNLAAVVEIGVVQQWPFVAYDPRDASTLSECLGSQGEPGAETAAWAVPALEGLAFAHEAGVAHLDVQAFLLLLDDAGSVRLMGLEVALGDGDPEPGRGGRALDAAELAAQRAAAERDVLAFGLLMHRALAGTPPLDEPDLGRAARLMPPTGREIVRLPWTLAQPMAEPLRAIVNRATDRQERHRYRNARTLLRALQGWLQTDADQGGGPLALLLDRLHTVGLLPASPGAAERAARMALMERERTMELAEVVLQDLALTFEMLRAVNTAQVRGVQVAGTGPVLTVRRAIAMLGLNGVRRAALGLRSWPGPLDAAGAAELQRLFERVQRTARVAQALRPPGYDAEVIYLITLLQNLGRLAVQYHFPEEAQQIRRLMESAPAEREGEPEQAGLSEESASFAVLGTDLDAMGVALARHWGLDGSVQHMLRRHSLSAPVRAADSDSDVLRLTASCANEAIEAVRQPAARVADAVQRVVRRYARPLNITAKDVQAALEILPTGGDHAARRSA